MEAMGWGRYPKTTADLIQPVDSQALQKFISSQKKSASCISRGSGRSYGDSALSAQLVSSRFLDSFLELDEQQKVLRCGAGVKLGDILKVCIPRGLFLPVLPGTKAVSLGGAIAADVHGKNHHLDGSFCAHVKQISLVLASGELVTCSERENTELFRATCGGMGLTGVIVDASLSLDSIPSSYIDQRSLVANNLRECFEHIQDNADSKYSVAWLDCLATAKNLGRSILYLGEHAPSKNRRTDTLYRERSHLGVPFSTPSFLLNKTTMSLFNTSYFGVQKRKRRSTTLGCDSYFFPLDSISNWNRLYGPNGFLQYQFVIPSEGALEGITSVLEKVSENGKGSFLTVLKKFGEANENLLSFPKSGYTLTLDFKNEPALFPLLEELDRIVLAHDGRLYLAKDARMSEEVFKASYPNWERFMSIKNKYDPNNRFASLQSNRLGLTQ
ncbi:MAG: FAD-linked oxidase [SAR86 cluster bacterium]|uniref:FAD-linked oxidase n=1 Tax=SAR86 cluster bacterium TaxID=2030880 RepID=A0A2A4WZR4_9GAMM|nr:MAG: FAD-linked oxidase [SAR86 cluster bacterium]